MTRTIAADTLEALDDAYLAAQERMTQADAARHHAETMLHHLQAAEASQFMLDAAEAMVMHAMSFAAECESWADYLEERIARFLDSAE